VRYQAVRAASGELYESSSAELAGALGPSILAIHQVGSTAVPGLCAKPTLDVVVSIPDFESGLQLVRIIESLGYEFRPDEEIPDRHYFRRRIGATRTHHLSLADPRSRYHRVTLALRDALRPTQRFRPRMPSSSVIWLEDSHLIELRTSRGRLRLLATSSSGQDHTSSRCLLTRACNCRGPKRFGRSSSAGR
jgi:GrpB protein